MPHKTASWRLGLWMGLLAGALHLAGYILYGIGIWNDAVHTNVVSWTLWVVGTIIAYFVYREIAHDWVKSLLNLVCVAGMFCIFGLVCYQLSLDPTPLALDKDFMIDMSIGIVDLFLMFIWILFRKRSLNVIDVVFQLDITVSFIPIMRATIADPSAETLLPWTLWTLAYLAQVFCVALRPDEENGVVDENSSKRSLNTPLNYLAWHLAMTMVLLLGGAALV